MRNYRFSTNLTRAFIYIVFLILLVVISIVPDLDAYC